jgi:hypothetical protein
MPRCTLRFLILGLVACSAGPEGRSSLDPERGDAGGTAGAAGQMPGGGAPNGHGGSPDADPGSDDAAGSVEPAEKGGSVFFIEHIFFVASAGIAARFYDSPADVSSCAVLQDEAGCRVTECPPVDGSLPLPTAPHAGTITYESPTIAGLVRIEPNERGVYVTAEDTRTERFADEVPAIFRATGGDVPAFEHRHDFPLRVILDEPMAPVGGTIAVSRDEDLVLRWSRALPDSIVMFSSRSEDASGRKFLSCSFDGAAGGATIPSAVLRDAPVDTAILYGFSATTVQVGEYTLRLGAGDQVVTPDRTAGIRLAFQ